MKSQNKMLAAAAILALAIAAFAIVPIGDSDADAFAITDVQVKNEGMQLVITTNMSLPVDTEYTIYLDDSKITSQKVTAAVAAAKVFKVALTTAIDDQEHTLKFDAGTVGVDEYTINPSAATQYTITIGENVTVTLDGTEVTTGQKVDKGAVVAVSAEEETGYTYTIYAGETALTAEQAAAYTVTADVEFSVKYTETPVTQNYTVDFDMTLLTVIYDGGKFVTPGEEIAAGTELTLRVSLPTGQVLTSITAVYDDETSEEVSEGTYTLEKNVEFVVDYEPEEYTLTIVEGTAKVFSETGLELETGATVTYGQIVKITAVVPEGKYVSGEEIVGLTENEDGTYTVVGEASVKFLYEDVKAFDLYLRNSKNPGVDFYLNGEKVNGTVTAKTGDLFEVKVQKGYIGTPAVTIGNVAVENPCELAFGGSVAITGVEAEDYKKATLSGDVVGETVFADYQIVTVSGSCTLTAGAEVLVNGQLVIPEGTTLTVQAGAVLMAYDVTVEGTLVIEAQDEDEDLIAGIAMLGAKPIVGAVIYDFTDFDSYLDQKGKTAVSGSIVANGNLVIFGEASVAGSLTVTETGGVATWETAVDVSGTVEIHGISRATYNDKGTVLFDSKVETGTGTNTVYMLADGAIVTVENYAFVDGQSLTVSDLGAEIGKSKVALGYENNVKVSAKPTTDNTVAVVSSLEVVQTIGKIGTADASILDVSGSVAVEGVSETADKPAATADLDLDGATRVTVSKTLTVAKDIEVTNLDKLYVSGSADFSATEFSNWNQIDVVDSGILKTVDEITDGINATEYTTTVDKVTVYNYVTIDTALAIVGSDSTVTALEVLGEQTVTASATLPAKVVLTVAGTLKIGASNGDGVQLTLADGSTLKGDGKVVVNGTLYAENFSNVKTKNVYSDVFTQQQENGKAVPKGWAKWTNIYTALEQASEGDKIEVTREYNDTEYTEITKNIEIPAGVTLYVGGGYAPLLLKDGVTMTVKGTLETEQDVYAQTMFGTAAMNVEGKKSSAVVVEGVILTLKAVTYGDSAKSTESAYAGMIAGAPIYGAYYVLDAQNAVSSVAYAMERFADINGKITINGVVSSDVSITGTSACKTVVVSDVKVKDMDGKDVATVLTGSVVLDNATLIANGTVKGTVSVGEGVATVEAAGFTAEDVEDALVLSGTFSGKTLEITAGEVAVKANASAVAVGIASGATLAADGATLGKISVSGVLKIAEGKSLAAGTVVLTGSGSIAAAENSNAVVDTIEAGVSAADYTGADISVVGKVTVKYQIFASTGAAIDEKTASELKSTTYYVDTTAFLVIYDATGAYDIYKVTKNVPVTNAYFNGEWNDASGNTVAAGSAIGAADKVYANVVYDVYDVIIKADEGIGNVYLNGIAMSRGMAYADGGYTYEAFITEGLTAGDYKVTYTLKNGFSGDATLYIDGNKQSSLTITASGTPDSAKHIQYVGQLSGITASGYVDPVTPVEKDDGLKVTDYLLIVLVILVVILAVIVALRLMRS